MSQNDNTLSRTDTIPYFDEDVSFYHSSHGTIVKEPLVINGVKILDLKNAKPGKIIEIVIKNRAVCGHTTDVGYLTKYGDMNRNFKDDEFTDYMYIKAKGPTIEEIKIANPPNVIDVYNFKNLQQNIDIPNIRFDYNWDFNMGIFKIEDDSDVKWGNLLPEDDSKQAYIHSENNSLLNKVVKMTENDTNDKQKITIYNSTCLYLEEGDILELYNKYPEWCKLFNIMLPQGIDKQIKTIETGELLRLNYKLDKLKNY